MMGYRFRMSMLMMSSFENSRKRKMPSMPKSMMLMRILERRQCSFQCGGKALQISITSFTRFPFCKIRYFGYFGFISLFNILGPIFQICDCVLKKDKFAGCIFFSTEIHPIESTRITSGATQAFYMFFSSRVYPINPIFSVSN